MTDTVWELSCNLDDMTPEDIAFAMERLLDAGALDVWTTPIGMKKNRPGIRAQRPEQGRPEGRTGPVPLSTHHHPRHPSDGAPALPSSP